jgi:hypothetical protein
MYMNIYNQNHKVQVAFFKAWYETLSNLTNLPNLTNK